MIQQTIASLNDMTQQEILVLDQYESAANSLPAHHHYVKIKSNKDVDTLLYVANLLPHIPGVDGFVIGNHPPTGWQKLYEALEAAGKTKYVA